MVTAAAAAAVVARAIVRLESGALIPLEISGNIGSVWVCLLSLCMRGKGAAAAAAGGAPAGATTC